MFSVDSLTPAQLEQYQTQQDENQKSGVALASPAEDLAGMSRDCDSLQCQRAIQASACRRTVPRVTLCNRRCWRQHPNGREQTRTGRWAIKSSYAHAIDGDVSRDSGRNSQTPMPMKRRLSWKSRAQRSNDIRELDRQIHSHPGEIYHRNQECEAFEKRTSLAPCRTRNPRKSQLIGRIFPTRIAGKPVRTTKAQTR